MSCDKPTTPGGLYQEASNSSIWHPHQSPQRLWDWWAYTTQMPFATSMVRSTAPGVGRRVKMREQSLTTCRWCTTGLVWCATNVTTTHQPHQTLSTATASRTIHPQEREPQQVSFIRVIASRRQAELICLNWESKQRSPGNWLPLGCHTGDTPCPLA